MCHLILAQFPLTHTDVHQETGGLAESKGNMLKKVNQSKDLAEKIPKAEIFSADSLNDRQATIDKS